MKKHLLNALLVLAFIQNGNAQNIIYVNHTATGNGDGSTWNNAYPNVADALSDAEIGDHLWVAKGTYNTLPENLVTPDRAYSITISKDSISIYGGFDGTETSLNQRDFSINKTIFTGDYNNTPLDETDDAYSVVRIDPSDTINYARLDGLTITHGCANSSVADHRRYGGGVYVEDHTKYIDVKNCIITENIAHGDAGISVATHYYSDYEINIENCHFNRNRARWRAPFGFIAHDGKNAKVNILNCLIAQNECGIVNGDSPSTGAGGGLVTNEAGILRGNIVNCSFVENSDAAMIPATERGLLMLGELTTGSTDVGNSVINIINTIAWDNDVATTFSKYTFPFYPDSIFVRNTNTADVISPVANVLLENHTNLDPLFTNSPFDFTLQSGSPMINTGTQVNLPISLPSVDLDGNARVIGAEIDLGCFEYGASNIDELEEDKYVLYPNPASNQLHIYAKNEAITHLEIIDLSGKIIQRLSGQPSSIDVSILGKGMYTLRIHSSKGISSMKFIRE